MRGQTVDKCVESLPSVREKAAIAGRIFEQSGSNANCLNSGD